MPEDGRGPLPRPAIKRELGKAEQALSDARAAHDAGISKTTIVTRQYYACFHAAQAALYARGFDPASHGQVQTWLGRELVAPGIVSREHGRFLSDMETYRRRVEYGSGGVERDVGELLDHTAAFLEAMREVAEAAAGD